MKVRPTMDFFSDVVLAVTNWAYSQAAAVGWRRGLEEGPAAHVLVAVLHALLPVRAVGAGAMRHLGVPSALTTGRPGLVMSAVKAVYQKICWAIWPWAGTGPASPKVMPVASLGAYFFIQSTYLVSA
jgi:hypothetical protein